MEAQEEDYFAPLGMPQTDFNSMVRRRNLADLAKQLIEQGRVTRPGMKTLTVLRNTARLVKAGDDVAKMPEPLVADVEDVARKSSSFYCRDVDEDSPRFAMFFDSPGGRSRSIASESQSPKQIPSLSRESSSFATLASSPPVTLSRATSISSYNSRTAAPKAEYCPPLQLHYSIHKPRRLSATKLQTSFPATSWISASVDDLCSGTAAPKPGSFSLENDPRYHTTLRMPDSQPNSMPATTSATDKVRDSNRTAQQPKSHEHTRDAVSRASTEPELDLPAAIVALMQQYGQQRELQNAQPPVDRIVELGRVRRAIETLNFGFDDSIMLASDLTSLVPVPSLPGSQERPEEEDGEGVVETCKFFRRRLARTVRRRVEFLKGELRVGDALRIEHWYKDVVDLVGWRDEDESRMSWSWLKNHGFF